MGIRTMAITATGITRKLSDEPDGTCRAFIMSLVNSPNGSELLSLSLSIVTCYRWLGGSELRTTSGELATFSKGRLDQKRHRLRELENVLGI
jgi:hypothetical protein